MFGMDFVVTVTGTAMALVCSILWVERPAAAPLLAVPILVAFLGYRAYVRERQGHEKVKFLYEANRTLSESPEVADALDGPARARAGGLPGRAGGGDPVRRRRRRAAAHRPRAGHGARGDGAGRRRRGRRAARAAPRPPTRPWR